MAREAAPKDHRRNPWHSRVGVCAIFLALFSLQASAALHQEQHHLADLKETCAACLQIDLFGAAVAPPAPGIDALPAAGVLSLPASVAAFPAARPAWFSRAPPVLT